MPNLFKKGFNYSEDGPGNRLVYHLCGCNLSCPWCANPEGMDVRAVRTVMTPEEIVKEAVSCRMMFFDGGGVTFTGGEATVQYEELSETLRLLKQAGINTCLETNATHPRLDGLYRFLDCLICDCKHYDEKRYKAATGGDLAAVKDNLTKAARCRTVHIRIPLINGFNASPEDAEGFAGFFDTLDKSHITVELLPYHEYGKDKWASLGRAYTVRDGFVTEDTQRHFAQVFTSHGIKIVHT